MTLTSACAGAAWSSRAMAASMIPGCGLIAYLEMLPLSRRRPARAVPASGVIPLRLRRGEIAACLHDRPGLGLHLRDVRAVVPLRVLQEPPGVPRRQPAVTGGLVGQRYLEQERRLVGPLLLDDAELPEAVLRTAPLAQHDAEPQVQEQVVRFLRQGRPELALGAGEVLLLRRERGKQDAGLLVPGVQGDGLLERCYRARKVLEPDIAVDLASAVEVQPWHGPGPDPVHGVNGLLAVKERVQVPLQSLDLR